MPASTQSLPASETVPVGIVGGTGYTGGELLNLLLPHPGFELTTVTARQAAGMPVAAHWPHLTGRTDLEFVSPDPARLADCRLVFVATPHATAMHMVPELLAAGIRVVDLSADFRLRDAEVWERWYGTTHAAPEALSRAVYGLPELNRERISGADLVANPGCYPTAVLLPLLPLIKARLVPGGLVTDAKSGVSGAGRKASENLLYGAVAENFAAYGVAGHRHQPEIEQGLADAGLETPDLTFVPHLLPMFRGMEATSYFDSTAGEDSLRACARDYYGDHPFVSVVADGEIPDTRSVCGSNLCRMAFFRTPRGKAIAVSVIDNLGKGAAGQAVQNANLMFGFPETCGLDSVPHAP